MKVKVIPLFQFVVAFFLAMAALSFNTTGFDFYHHVISVMSWEAIAALNPFWVFPGGIQVPRYLLGHHILYLMSLGVIPLAWVVVTLEAVLLVLCLRRLDKGSWYLSPLLGLFFSYNMVYMSMTGMGSMFVLLAILAHRSGEAWLRWLWLGAAFHPVSFLLTAILSLFFLPKGKSFFVLLSVVVLSILVTFSYSEGVASVRELFASSTFFWSIMGRLMGRLELLVSVFAVGAGAYAVQSWLRSHIRIPRFPLPGALAVAIVLICTAGFAGSEAQFQRGGGLAYFVNGGYLGPFHTDKNRLICAAWVSRGCYEEVWQKESKFRQES